MVRWWHDRFVRLLLIRHGQTPHNVTGALDTAYPGAGLTALGRVQARAVPDVLTEPVAGVYASPLVRTQLTAEPLALARGTDIRVRRGLEEISAGELELRSDEGSRDAYIAALVRWMRGDVDHVLGGGESGRGFLARYTSAVEAIAAEHAAADTVALFSHGAAIRVFATAAAGLTPDRAADLSIMNTGMGVLEGDPRTGWRLAGWSSEPLGGLGLEDPVAEDITGESAEEVLDD